MIRNLIEYVVELKSGDKKWDRNVECYRMSKMLNVIEFIYITSMFNFNPNVRI